MCFISQSQNWLFYGRWKNITKTHSFLKHPGMQILQFYSLCPERVVCLEGWGKACHKFLLLGRYSIIKIVVSLVIFTNNHTNSSTGEGNVKSWFISVFFSLLNSSLTLLFLVLANNLFILLRSSCLLFLFFSSPKAMLNQQTCELFFLTCAFIWGLSPITMYPK